MLLQQVGKIEIPADVEAKKRALATRGVFSIGRYGSWTYCSIEDNMVETRELAAKLIADL